MLSLSTGFVLMDVLAVAGIVALSFIVSVAAITGFLALVFHVMKIAKPLETGVSGTRDPADHVAETIAA